MTLTTLNGVKGYSITFPISLTGTEVSQEAFLAIAPTTADYGGLVLLDDSKAAPSNFLTFNITNAGVSPLTILGYGYTTDELDDDDVDWTNTTFGGPTQDLGYGSCASDLPVVGTVIAGGAQISVDSTFYPVNGTGSYLSYFNIYGALEDSKASYWKVLLLRDLSRISQSAMAKAVGCLKATFSWTLATSSPGHLFLCRFASVTSVAPCSKLLRANPLLASSVWMTLLIYTSHNRSLSISVLTGQSYLPLTPRTRTIQIRDIMTVGS